jgi:hypothetical protein
MCLFPIVMNGSLLPKIHYFYNVHSLISVLFESQGKCIVKMKLAIKLIL